jgi:hypothetical protein
MVNRVKSDLINKLVEKSIELEIIMPKSIRGCTNNYIKKLEKKYNIKLPRLYKDFLLAIGKPKDIYGIKGDDYGFGLFSDFYIYYPKPTKLTDNAKKYLKVDKSTLYPFQNYFVFCWGASDFYFFSTEKGDDPPVHYYLEKNAYENRQKNIKDYEESWKESEEKRRFLYTPNGGEVFSSLSEFFKYQIKRDYKIEL